MYIHVYIYTYIHIYMRHRDTETHETIYASYLVDNARTHGEPMAR